MLCRRLAQLLPRGVSLPVGQRLSSVQERSVWPVSWLLVLHSALTLHVLHCLRALQVLQKAHAVGVQMMLPMAIIGCCLCEWQHAPSFHISHDPG
jgi:hypothetical protein